MKIRFLMPPLVIPLMLWLSSVSSVGGTLLRASRALQPASSPGSGSSCSISELFLRTSLGFPIQVEHKGFDYEATMCEDMPNFLVQVKQVEPIFSSGDKCSVTGVPEGKVDVESGSSQSFTINTVKTSKDGNGTNIEVHALTVRRLSPGMDPTACAVTRSRTAAQDCGYAPTVEKRRQEAALVPGLSELQK
mmetsp:Transcript_15100/g.33207  ORF Transcript_15100/g.33207 Transcript_15100/m.33207 type:complete len:191 (+) Transcript_15100:22-594(+)